MRAGKWFTVGWGVIAMGFALFASQVDNLIQAVNTLGSIFYGPMLGVFLVRFFFKSARGTPPSRSHDRTSHRPRACRAAPDS